MPDKVRGNPLTGFYGSLSVNSKGGAKHDVAFDRNLGCCINLLLVCGGDCDGKPYYYLMMRGSCSRNGTNTVRRLSRI